MGSGEEVGEAQQQQRGGAFQEGGGVPRLVVRAGVATAEACAAHSRATFASLRAGEMTAPELWLLSPTTQGVLRGAFQDLHAGPWTRASGGAEVAIGPGTLHLMFAVPSPGSLGVPNADALVNRLVRPLLKALTRAGALANYFGRDWISVAPSRRPIALVGFAHEAATARGMLEAFVAVSAPFARGVAPRTSYRGKLPATLAELGVSAGIDEVRELVARAYELAYARAVDEMPLPLLSPLSPVEAAGAPPVAPSPWTSALEDAIGAVLAARDASGAVRIGGDLLVSCDALAELERAATAAKTRAEVELASEALADERVALLGTRPQTIAEAVLALGGFGW